MIIVIIIVVIKKRNKLKIRNNIILHFCLLYSVEYIIEKQNKKILTVSICYYHYNNCELKI